MDPANNLTRRHFIRGLGLAASAPWLAGSVLAADQTTVTSQPAAHRVLSCNIRIPQEVDETGGNGWAARKEMCADIILAQHPDIVCLQECTGMQLDYLKSRWPNFESFGLANPDTVFNPLNSVLFSRSRYVMVTAGGFWLSQTPHVAGSKSWDSARVRFANWVHLKDRQSGRDLRVWNTHLDHIGQRAREEQARVVSEAGEAFPVELPQILTGDFNANASNPAIELVKKRGWKDAYSTIHGAKEPEFTFHAFWGPEYNAKAVKDRIRGQIDWIFCRGPVKVHAAEIIREGRNGRYPSDHYFMSADLAL